MEEMKKQEGGINEAMAYIQMIRAKLSAMGANDYEMDALRQIEEDLKAGKITPQEAKEKAHHILSNKQDYH